MFTFRVLAARLTKTFWVISLEERPRDLISQFNLYGEQCVHWEIKRSSFSLSCLLIILFHFNVLFGTSPKKLLLISLFSYVKITLLNWDFCLLSTPKINSRWYAELLTLRCHHVVSLKFFNYRLYSIKYLLHLKSKFFSRFHLTTPNNRGF